MGLVNIYNLVLAPEAEEFLLDTQFDGHLNDCKN